MDFSDVLIYGAYGYTGKLIVELAVSKGYQPIVAGRDKEKVVALAEKYKLQYNVFDIEDDQAWDSSLQGINLLLNCAGPFSLTIKKILPACIRNSVNYTDITGEITVFEYISQYHNDALSKGIVLMPGTGFDVVPSDCLAAFLKNQMPEATHLELAFDSRSGLSRGTALSVLNRFHEGSAYRKDGKIIIERIASESKSINYAGEDRHLVRVAWGDVFTAFHSTGIPNISVYTGMPPKTQSMMRKAARFKGLIKRWPIQQIFRSMIKKRIDGPSENRRNSLQTFLWGKVVNTQGHSITAELVVPESYKLTAITAIMCAEGILNGKVESGYTTPAKAFGHDFIMQVEGVSRKLTA